MSGESPDSAILKYGKYSDKLTWTPKQPEARAVLEAIGTPMRMASEGLGELGGMAGKALGNENLGRTIGENLVPAIGAAAGVKRVWDARVPPAQRSIPQQQQAVLDAKKAGFMADPARSNPTLFNKAVVAYGDHERVQHAIAKHNGELVNTLTKEELGIPAKSYLDASALDSLKKAAGRVYDRVKAVPGDIPVTPKFQQEIVALSDKFENLKQFAPDLYQQQGLERVKGALATPQSPAHPNAYTASAIVDITKNLREKSNKILSKAEITDSEYHEAAALRAGATALENLLEDNLKTRFPPGTPAVQSGRFLVDEWRKARQDLAKVYDVEGVSNLKTGDVNPLRLQNCKNMELL